MSVSPDPGSAGYTLSTARWPDVAAGPRRLLVVPIGSLEQHGPHLPLDTDTRIAAAVAARACAGRAGVGLAPPLAIGASGEHADFPGTLSIGTEALAHVLVELGRHAALHWPAMLLVNGHGGNAPAISEAVRRLRAEGRHCHVRHAALRSAPKTRTADGTVHGAGTVDSGMTQVTDAHAGRTETSIMLALAPREVRLAAAVPGEVRPLAEIMPELRARGVRHVSANGVLGDPSGASATEGEHFLAMLADDLSETIDMLTGHHT